MVNRASQIRALIRQHSIPVDSNTTAFTKLNNLDNHTHDQLFAGVDTLGYLTVNIPIKIVVTTLDWVVRYHGTVILSQRHWDREDIFVITADNDNIRCRMSTGHFNNVAVFAKLLAGKSVKTRTKDGRYILVTLAA